MADCEFSAGNVVVSRYVESLYGASVKSDAVKEVAEQISSIKATMTIIPNYRKFLKRMSFFPKDGLEFVEFLKKNLNLRAEVSNFLDLLLVNDRFYMIVDMCDAFSDYLDKISGKKRVYLTLAKNQEESTLRNLVNKIRESFGEETECITRLNPALKGGFTLQYQSKVLDYSLASKLRRLKSAIRREGYEN